MMGIAGRSYDISYDVYYPPGDRPVKNAAGAATWLEQLFVVYMI
jgi:hypothetical protein